MLPIYGLVALGYIAGKYLKIKKEAVATLLIYTITPIVVFTSVATTKLNSATIALPLMIFLISCLIASIVYGLSGFIWKNETRNMVAFISGSANSGYFGLPAGVALFGSRAILPIVLSVVGTTLYLNSFGFFLAAKGRHTTKASLKKLRQLPVIYAFVLGLVISLLHVHLSPIYTGAAANFNGALIVLGMMLVGMGLADIKKFVIDPGLISISLLAKFVLWPGLMLGVILLDKHSFQIFDPSIHKIMVLMAIVPVAANVVAYATVLKTEPEQSSLAVFISTLFALIYIPFIAAVFF